MGNYRGNQPLSRKVRKRIEEKRVEQLQLQMTRRELMRWQSDRCYYCTRRLDGYTATFDHIKLKRDGGPVSVENGVVACKPCNSLREDMPFDEFCADIGVTTARAHRHEQLRLVQD